VDRVEEPVKPPRRYRSTLRETQAEATKDRIVDAARELFVRHGYSRTTIRAIAVEAGVSEMTVYSSFGDKRSLLEAVITKVVGRPDYRPDPARINAIRQLPTPRERLQAMTRLTCDLLKRTSPINAVIRGAVDTEPFAHELRTTMSHIRLATQRKMLRMYVHGALRHGLTETDAAERHFAFTCPELHHVVTTQLGWSQRRYARWLSDTLERELLDPERADALDTDDVPASSSRSVSPAVDDPAP